MADDAAIHLPKGLSAALAAEAARTGVSVDWDLLDRGLSRPGGEAPAKDDRLPAARP